MPRATDLTVRSGNEVLPVAVGLGTLTWKSIVTTTSCGGSDAWRLVELASRKNLPFAARMTWTNGEAGGFAAHCSISRATRICVHATALSIEVANYANATNEVVCGIADGFFPTINQWEESGSAVNGVIEPVQIPPFAERFRVELADPTLLATCEITVIDGFASVRSVTMGDQQPEWGIPLGAAHSVQILTTGNVAYRVVYFLRI